MTEAELTHLMAANRQVFVGWLQASLFLTLAVFFLAYVIRNTPMYVRGAVFLSLLLGTFSFRMVMNIVNEGFLAIVGDLAKLSQEASVSAFSKGAIDALGATATAAPSLPVWAVVAPGLIFLLNLGIGLYLLLLEKWESSRPGPTSR